MVSSNPIRVLPEHVARKIAAGEVIDRPSSIVKELMENSIDAHATKIEIFVTNGGMGHITIQDDGVGIASDEIALTIEKNATSKIVSDEDLTRLHTFGFRGEALSSISAVSKFELLSKRRLDHEGSLLKVNGDGDITIEPSGAKDGTRVQISNLFFNTPARKKFLRSKSTEFAHIEKTFKKIALAHPEVSFTLFKDDVAVYQLPAVLSDLERIGQLYPQSMTSTLTPLQGARFDIKIHGFVSNSQATFAGAQEIWLFINRRWITDRMLQKAVLEGYRTALMDHRYPMAFVYIDLPPDQFDVNVHPTKAEIKFEKPQNLFNTLSFTVASTLRRGPARHNVNESELSTLTKNATFDFANIAKPYPFTASAWTSTARESKPEYKIAGGFFSSLECLGSLDHTYILCRSSDALLIIDQHAAHERVLYDQFKNHFQNHKAPRQSLLIPLALELSAAQFENMVENKRVLEAIGFDIEEFGDRTWIIRAIPAGLKEKHCQQIFLDFIEDSLTEKNSKTFQDRNDHILATMACHAAVRAHDVLNLEEIRSLLSRMDEVDLSSYCPHGRPTFLKLTKDNLEVLFKRV